MKVEAARRAVAVLGNAWKLRIAANADRDTARTRRALYAAADKLDDAITEMFDAVHAQQRSRR